MYLSPVYTAAPAVADERVGAQGKTADGLECLHGVAGAVAALRQAHAFEAGRPPGIAVLSDTGRQIEVTLRLPVLPETGVIEPGAFIAYQDGGVARLGIVRSTRVDAALPEVWQTLGVQSHA